MKANLLTDLSLSQVKKLVTIKERTEKLSAQKQKLEKDLAKVDRELARLFDELTGLSKKKTRKKVKRKARAKATGKKARRVAKKTAAKVGKKAGRKKAVRKAAAKKAGRKAPARKAGGKLTLEDVVVGLIKKRGKPIPFQDLLKTITRKKLVKTRSSNFDNVLRRTLSTSSKLKRAGRGIYDVA